MPTYGEYVRYMVARKVQPLREAAFTALINAGYNPITNQWR